MKKNHLFILLVLFLLLPASSARAEAQTGEEGGIRYFVSDAAGVLQPDEWQLLEQTARQVSEKYQCGTYIAILADYQEYGTFRSFWDFSEAFYTRYNLGLGEEKNGILLLLSMKDRDFSLIAYGSQAHYAFTDYGKDVLEKTFLDDFREDRWFSGCRDYLEECDELLERASRGDPLDVSNEDRKGIPDSASIAIIVFAPILSALGVCEGMKRQMKPVREKTRADEYILPGGIHLDVRQDNFENRTVTRTQVRTEHREGSFGGGGTSVNSSGFSGHSGKF